VYEVGFIKPDHQIYDAIIEKSGFRKEEILFVGDTLIADYEGPRQYGFRALHLCRDQTPKDDQIQSLGVLVSTKSDTSHS
jgi:FMN phosphatase YigB (HAD superfamily)